MNRRTPLGGLETKGEPMQTPDPSDLEQAIDDWRIGDKHDVEKAIGSLKRLRVAVTERIEAYERLIGEQKRSDADDEANPARPL